MPGIAEHGYLLDPVTGEITPCPEAPYGWICEPIAEASDDPDSVGEIRPSIRPATREEAEAYHA